MGKQNVQAKKVYSSESSSMVLTADLRLFRLDKINHRLRLYCNISRSSPGSKLYCRSFFKSGILLQQPPNSTSGRRFCALFECVLHHPQGNERTGDIQPSWVDVVQSLNSPFFPPLIGAEPGRAKEESRVESRITYMRMLRTNQSDTIKHY